MMTTTGHWLVCEDGGGHEHGHDGHWDDADGTGETTACAHGTIDGADRKSYHHVRSWPLTRGGTGLTWRRC